MTTASYSIAQSNAPAREIEGGENANNQSCQIFYYSDNYKHRNTELPNLTLKPPKRGAEGKIKMTTTEKKIKKVYYELSYYVESEFTVELDRLPEDAEDEDDFVSSALGGYYDDADSIDLQEDENGDFDSVDTDPQSNDLEHNSTSLTSLTKTTLYDDGTRKIENLS